MTAMSLSADDVIRFWFEEAEVTQWFSQSDDFDQRIRERFGHLLEAAARGIEGERRSPCSTSSGRSAPSS